MLLRSMVTALVASATRFDRLMAYRTSARCSSEQVGYHGEHTVRADAHTAPPVQNCCYGSLMLSVIQCATACWSPRSPVGGVVLTVAHTLGSVLSACLTGTRSSVQVRTTSIARKYVSAAVYQHADTSAMEGRSVQVWSGGVQDLGHGEGAFCPLLRDVIPYFSALVDTTVHKAWHAR